MHRLDTNDILRCEFFLNLFSIGLFRGLVPVNFKIPSYVRIYRAYFHSKTKMKSQDVFYFYLFLFINNNIIIRFILKKLKYFKKFIF